MKCSTISLRLCLASLCITALPIVACSDDSVTRSADGRLSLALLTTTAAGQQYRLEHATFDVAGPEARVIRSKPDSTEATISASLRAGDYTLTLRSGWFLARRGPSGEFSKVPALLLSDNPQSFSIESDKKTDVRLRFKAGDDDIDFGRGILSIGIEVETAEGGAGGMGGAGGADPGALTLEQPELPEATFNSAYRVPLHARGGTGSHYTFTISSGALPQGLSLSSNGLLTGMPTVEGNFQFEVTVQDTATSTATAAFSLQVGRHRWVCYGWSEEYENNDTGEYTYTVHDERFNTAGGSGPQPDVGCNFTPAGKWFVDGAAFRDATGPVVGEPITPTLPACDRLWAPGERWFACIGANAVQFAHLSSPATSAELAVDGCSSGLWSPSGARIALDCGGRIHVTAPAAARGGVASSAGIVDGTALGWVSDRILAVKTADGALAAARFEGGEFELTRELASAATVSKLVRVNGETDRALFADETPAAYTLVDFAAHSVSPSRADDPYSRWLDYSARFVTGTGSPHVDVLEAATQTPILSLPASALLGWSEDGTTVATQSEDGARTAFTRVAAERTLETTFRVEQILGWGYDDRWAIVKGAERTVLLNLASDTIEEHDTSTGLNLLSVAPSRQRFYFSDSSPSSSLCVVTMTAAGPTEPYCEETFSPANSVPIAESSSWSSDSTVVFTPNVSFYPLGIMAQGLQYIRSENGTQAELVLGYYGIQLHQSFFGLSLQP